MPKVSIIIPVFSGWRLSRNCLDSIAANAPAGLYEVIVVDSGSSDETAKAAPVVGARLFGDHFEYIRNDSSPKFAGAANQGAAVARGEYIVFLDSATGILAEWLENMLRDFDDFAGIAATGSVQLYPEIPLVGYTIRNLGMCISPYSHVVHLYKGIPADSPLAKKRRFFQAIPAGCLMMPKNLFVEAGGFAEKFMSGLEDVELCARLAARGYRLTINPSSRVIHYDHHTHGRKGHNGENRQRLANGSLAFLQPDWREYLARDGLKLKLTRLQKLQPAMPPKLLESLDKMLDRLDSARLVALLKEHPYWEKGWMQLTRINASASEALASASWIIFDSPEIALQECARAIDEGRGDQALPWLERFEPYSRPFLSYFKAAGEQEKWMNGHGLAWLGSQYAEWAARAGIIKNHYMVPFFRLFLQFNQFLTHLNSPCNRNIYAAWLDSAALPAIVSLLASKRTLLSSASGISLVMIIRDPVSPCFSNAVQSLLDQGYKNWELLVVCGGEQSRLGSFPEDDRIRLFDPETDDAAKSLNLAFQAASFPWIAIMDADGYIPQDGLGLLAYAIATNPKARLFYGGEDHIDESMINYDPYFKSEWDPLLAYCQDYLHRLTVYNRARAVALEFRSEAGAAFEYDFNLRYCRRLAKKDIVHIAQVIYHKQKSPEEGLIGINASLELAEAANRTLNDFLRDAIPGARTELGQDRLMHIVWPDSDLEIALICEMKNCAQADIREFCQKWQAADEIIILCDEPVEKCANARLLIPPQELDSIERLNWAARQTSAQIIGFVKKEVSPINGDWRRHFAGFSGYAFAGAWSGKIVRNNGRLLHGGYLGDAFGNMRPIFRDADSREQNWFNWTRLARTVLAFGGECIFTLAENFIKNSGFDASCGEWAFQDYCWRLYLQGMNNVWLADALFACEDELSLPLETDGFIRKWYGDFPSFNENLIIVKSGLGLTRYPRIAQAASGKSRSLSLRDYGMLYFVDGNLNGMEPMEHYYANAREGILKSHRSKLDYSGHTGEMRKKFAASQKSGVIVCTALTGDYEKLLPPLFVNMDWQYICYTDQDREGWGIWEMRRMPYQDKDPRRMARWVKTHLPELFPDAKRVIWIDANIIITTDLAPVLAEREDCPLALMEHLRRDCAYEEGEVCMDAELDSPEKIVEQMRKYEREGLPRHTGLYETNIMLLDPQNELVRKIFVEWSYEIEHYSRRDQISLPYVLYKNNFTPCILIAPGINARNYKGCEYLMHQETRWIYPPCI